jgi:hypothetical protein
MRRADPQEVGDVLAVLDEAAAWLGERGVRQRQAAGFRHRGDASVSGPDPGPAITVSRYELELLWNAPGDADDRGG